MKKILLLCAFCVSTAISFAQKETFDLTTYTPPKGWKKQPAESAVQFAKEDAAKGTYCLITLYKAVPGTDNAKENFDLAWTSLVKEMVTVATPPEMQASAVENGWETQSGYAPFENDGNKGVVVLVTASSVDKMVNLIILTNTDVYEKEMSNFLESVTLKKPETNVQSTPAVNDDKNSIIGTWIISQTFNQQSKDLVVKVMGYGYNTKQYTFNSNNSYSFVSKTFMSSHKEMLLVKENGTYQINGNNISINPQKNVVEEWSKKDSVDKLGRPAGVDKWGKILSSKKGALEKITYQLTKHYFSGIQQWNLVLQNNTATQRDGPFSSNTTFNNAWYYSPISPNNPVIELPAGEQQAMEKINNKYPVKQPGGNSFAFTTTNFDDGWTSTVQEDWVQVTKANIKVLIHYPNKQADAYNSVVMDGLKTAWNVLVAPRYSSAGNFEFKPITGWQPIEFAEADAIEKTTGKTFHVVLFKMNYSGGNGRYLEFITTNKSSFEQEFGAYHETTSGWEKMENMANYNKFAVAASDLKGKWTSNFSGMQQYVNAYTGASAGADTHASNETFEFEAGNTYKWNLGVASGFVGNIKFQSVKSNGKFSLPNIWQVHFSDIEGKPKTYNTFFTCIKGARVLWIGDTGFGKKE